MWQRLKNLVSSLKTYADLSPDLRSRQRVHQFLRDRPSLSATEWFETFWQSRKIARPVADFVYTRMQHYTGIEFARVRPSDRLQEDLLLPLICWFDWEMTFCEDFLERFGVELPDCFDTHTLSTVEDLLVFLNHQMLSIDLLRES